MVVSAGPASSASRFTEHVAQGREGVALGNDELGVLMRDISLDVPTACAVMRVRMRGLMRVGELCGEKEKVVASRTTGRLSDGAQGPTLRHDANRFTCRAH